MSEAFQPLDPVLDLLGGENVVALRPSFARAFGGVTVGVLLSQFWFYSRMDTARARDGWFYASQEQIEEETGMTRTEQETARRKLREAGILSETKRGIPARLYYLLDKERLAVQLRLWLVEEEARQNVKAKQKEAKRAERQGASTDGADLFAGNLQASTGKTRTLACGKSPNKQAQKVHAIPKTPLRNTEKTLKEPELFASHSKEKSAHTGTAVPPLSNKQENKKEEEPEILPNGSKQERLRIMPTAEFVKARDWLRKKGGRK